MKRMLWSAVVVFLAVSTLADMVTWDSQYLYANVPLGTPADTDGAGWQVDIAVAGSSALSPSSSCLWLASRVSSLTPSSNRSST